MVDLKKYENFDDFLLNYEKYNEKNRYFKITRDAKIIIEKPSYVLEFAYMYILKNFEKILEVFNFNNIVIKKRIKLKRHSSLNIEILEDRFFRALFNRDMVHILSLGNELLRRNENIFFDIMYMNAKLSNDENRLIKLYLFEYIYKEIGLKEPLLINLLRYFTSSLEGYNSDKKVDELYSYIYEVKFFEKKNINKELDLENKYILDFFKTM